MGSCSVNFHPTQVNPRHFNPSQRPALDLPFPLGLTTSHKYKRGRALSRDPWNIWRTFDYVSKTSKPESLYLVHCFLLGFPIYRHFAPQFKKINHFELNSIEFHLIVLLISYKFWCHRSQR